MTSKQPTARRANNRAFPEWAKRAVANFDPAPARGETAPSPAARARQTALAKEVHNAWPALCERVVPAFDRLPDDLVRQRVFQNVLGLLLKYRDDPAHYVRRRKAQRNADKLAHDIVTKAGELADLLCEAQELIEVEHVALEMPDLFDCLDSWLANAWNNPEHEAWASVAEDSLQQFLKIAREQSRPSPDLAELMQIVAEWPRVEAREPQSRKAVSDLRRELLRRLDPEKLNAVGAPVGFHFTATAIADLLTVLFAVDTDADDVRKLLKGAA